MLNRCSVSLRQKNFDAHCPFSFAQHRWAETESKRQESARCSLYTETVLAKTVHSSLLTAITCQFKVLFRISWLSGMFGAL
jgi:hypothetical protein